MTENKPIAYIVTMIIIMAPIKIPIFVVYLLFPPKDIGLNYSLFINAFNAYLFVPILCLFY